MKTAKIVKFVTVNGYQVPVYAPQQERTLSINVNRIIAGVIFGSLAAVVSALVIIVA